MRLRWLKQIAELMAKVPEEYIVRRTAPLRCGEAVAAKL